MAAVYKSACEACGSREIVAVSEGYTSGASELHLNGHRTIELLHDRLVDLDLAPLAVALEDGNPFSTVNLSYNKIGAGGAQSLQKLLEKDSKIEALDLSENDLDATAVQALCSGLKVNTSVKELKLSGNKMGGAGGMAVAELAQSNNMLQRLALANCGLDTASLVALATVLRDNKGLTSLDISRPLQPSMVMDEATSHFARALAVNTTLVELHLAKSGIRDHGLQLLVEELYFAGPASQLQVLGLQGNQIRLSDAESVSALGRLLSSEGCRVNTLLLGSNGLKDEGALKLAEVVETSRNLRKLDVGFNGISSRGLCALARSVSSHPTLEEAMLWGNRFDSAACLAWIPSLDFLKLDLAVQEVDGAFNAVQC